MPATLGFDLEINVPEFEYFTLRELRGYVEKIINRNKASLNRDLRTLVYQKLLKSNFYEQFTKGPMYYEIGNPNAEMDLKGIFRLIADDMLIDFPVSVVSNGQLNLDIIIGILDSSYYEILTSPHSSYISMNSEGKRTLIEWIKWLLIGGSGPLIFNYEYRSDPKFSKWSRTGEAIMIKSRNNWGLRQVWVGKPGDNVLTRSLEGIELTITKILDLRIISKL